MEAEAGVRSKKIEAIEAEVAAICEAIAPVKSPGEAVLSIMEYGEEELRALSAQDCAEACFTLSKYIMFIQRESNANNAKLRWATTNLEYVCNMKNPPSYVISKSEAAMNLEGFRLKCQMRVDAYSFISQSASNIMRSLENLGKYKNSERF